MIFPILVTLLACGPKKPPEPPVAPAPVAAPAPPPAPVAAPEPEPEPPAPPPEVRNADFNATVTMASGETRSGHVKRLERSSDWYAEEGWTSEPGDLVISAESSTEYKKLAWTEVKSVSIAKGKVPADVSCIYDSNWQPWMYDCTLKTTATVTDTSGKKYTVDNRHKWKLTFDDDSSVEFWLKKHPAREQDEEVVTLDSGTTENYDLYTKLQNRLREEVKTTLVVSVKID